VNLKSLDVLQVLPVELVQALNVAKQDSVILGGHFAGHRVGDLSDMIHVTLTYTTATDSYCYYKIS